MATTYLETLNHFKSPKILMITYMALTFLILVFHGTVVVLFYKIKIIHSSPPILVMSLCIYMVLFAFSQKTAGEWVTGARIAFYCIL